MAFENLGNGSIETAKQFPDDNVGWAQRWNVEMNAAKENQRAWTERGDRVVKRFTDDREGEPRLNGETRVNLFTANVQTLRALLYGKTPQVDVKRRFADPNDDIARVAGEILQRLLNTDIEKDSDTYAESLESALSDRLLPGLGVVRCRYEAEFEDRETPAITRPDPLTGQMVELAPAFTETVKKYECVPVDYVHWRDFRWSPCRTWDEVRWVAFRVPMTRDQLDKRFGKDVSKLVPMTANRDKSKDTLQDATERNQAWQRAEVWEIWSKEQKQIFWWVDGYDHLLDRKDDTLGLDGFWPVPRPMFANLTTSRLMPTPDFTLAQDLYNEIDSLSSRITLLERAVAARGVYDKTSEEVKRVLSESVANELIPADNFALFKEKGGLQSVIDWLPIDLFVGALKELEAYRQNLMALLFQVTGMSDIMRGQASSGATATEQALKAKFASTRVQEFQNEFARFASDAQRIKAEIISKHYDEESIAKESNVQFMFPPDQQNAGQAIALLKSDFYQYRIEVKPESVAMADMAAVKQERGEFLMSVATFLQSAGPIGAQAPWSIQYLLQMLSWSMAGFRGSSSIEGVMDQMVVAANQAQQAAAANPQPNPEQQKMQMEQQKMAAQLQADQQKAQMEMQIKQVEMEMKKQEAQMDLLAKRMGLELDMQKAKMDFNIQAQKAELDTRKQQTDAALSQQQAEFDFEAQAKQADMDEQKGVREEARAIRDHELGQEQQEAQHKAKMQQAKESANKPKGK
jgi:hypothetical protein